MNLTRARTEFNIIISFHDTNFHNNSRMKMLILDLFYNISLPIGVLRKRNKLAKLYIILKSISVAQLLDG
jgi:hypothetical protein